MALTLEQLKRQLSDIEPNEATYQGLGPAEVPLLEQLVQAPDHFMASRAVFALSRIHNADAMHILQRAAGDPRPQVRVAVASGSAQIPVNDRKDILVRLLADSEVGVRKFAILAATGITDRELQERLKRISNDDPHPALRALASEKLKEIQ
jgi:FOG: HEAT repeat